MSDRRNLSTGLAVLASLVAIVMLPVPVAVADTATETYIVQLKSGVSADKMTGKLMGASARVIHKVFQGGIVKLTAAQAQALAASPDVKSVHKDAVVRATGTEAGAPWDLDVLDNTSASIDGSYSYPNDGSGVTVYVLDSGVMRTHSEFAGASVSAGYDFYESDSDPQDCSGHGTAVSSLIAGATLGASKGVTLVPLRVLDCSGTGSESDIIRAADYIATNHAAGTPAVANLSFGIAASDLPAGDTSLETAFQGLIDSGVTVVAAAGNGDPVNHVGVDACTEVPARLPAAITVGSVNRQLAESSFSNYGNCVDLYAPGESVYVADKKSIYSIAQWSGTSFSAPLVTAAAAQVLHDHPTWAPSQVVADITSRAASGLIGHARSANLLLNVTGHFAGTAPTITGGTYAGETAQASLHWSPVPVSVAYQWYRDGVAIPSATSPTYVTTLDDVDRAITVSATASDSGFVPMSATSSAVVPQLGLTMTSATPTISGSPAVSYTLTADPGTEWDPADVALSYGWRRDGVAIQGANAATYAPAAADVGHTLTVRVTGSKPGYVTASGESVPTAVIQGATSSLAYEGFVKAAYQDFLGRQPTADELAVATSRLSSGAVSKPSYLSGLTRSDEWLTAIVTKMYNDTLGRGPDPSGLADWTSWLRSGRFTVAEAASRFYSSDEYFTNHAGNTPSSWITLLYQRLLNRDPDGTGLQFWINKTSIYGRDWVATNFYQSQESRERRVEAMYQVLLHREPDPVGWPFWTSRVLTTGDLTLAWEIANSDEYWARAHVRY